MHDKRLATVFMVDLKNFYYRVCFAAYVNEKIKWLELSSQPLFLQLKVNLTKNH